MRNSGNVLIADGETVIDREWAAVYADRILLKEPTEGELRKQMARTRVPEGTEVVALPKAHGSIWI